MCGTYHFSDEDNQEIIQILKTIDKKYGNGAFKGGDLYPNQKAPVLLNENHKIEPVLLTWWQHPDFNPKLSVFNVRQENIFMKNKMFYRYRNNRCIVPTSWFYEYSKERNEYGHKMKYKFCLPNEDITYIAGLYNNDNEFTIITTEPNQSVKEIHNRMPVVIPKSTIEDWIFDDTQTESILHTVPPELKCERVV